MYATTHWLNDYLDPAATSEEQADLMTRAGFPHEGSEPVLHDDVRHDFAMTSNRGDVNCHIGMAREIAALSQRQLVLPKVDFQTKGGPVAKAISIRNDQPEGCPLYTARVITGVKVAPSPDWLAKRLEARGDIPRNNIVDATNFVLFELGQPTHVFDLKKLTDSKIIIRQATQNESFLPIGEGAMPVKLTTDDLVIADAKRAVAMAGVKGGAETAVTETTTDILIEAATFDPIAVRNTSRRHNIASDSSYRFERGVPAATIQFAADRLTQLILEIAGGTLLKGVVAEGLPITDQPTATMNCGHCRHVIGVEISDQEMCESLDRLGFLPQLQDGVISVTAPSHRLDVNCEIDLIEEVARMHGFDKIPVTDTIALRPAPPVSRESGRTAVHNALVGMDFLEIITHTLLPRDAGTPFLSAGATLMEVEDERAKAASALRPSMLPSLLRVRATNQDAGVSELRLFESGSVFWRDSEQHHERQCLSLLFDMTDPNQSPRELRGVIDHLAHTLLGAAGCVEIQVLDQPAAEVPYLNPASKVLINGQEMGHLGLLNQQLTKSTWGIDTPLLAAELELPRLYDQFPPVDQVIPLPHFPAIERDISAIVAENTPWLSIHNAITSLGLADLEVIDFVEVFRGKPIDQGMKSVTMRLRFRAADRTLTHNEIEPLAQQATETLQSQLNAEIRAGS